MTDDLKHVMKAQIDQEVPARPTPNLVEVMKRGQRRRVFTRIGIVVAGAALVAAAVPVGFYLTDVSSGINAAQDSKALGNGVSAAEKDIVRVLARSGMEYLPQDPDASGLVSEDQAWKELSYDFDLEQRSELELGMLIEHGRNKGAFYAASVFGRPNGSLSPPKGKAERGAYIVLIDASAAQEVTAVPANPEG